MARCWISCIIISLFIGSISGSSEAEICGPVTRNINVTDDGDEIVVVWPLGDSVERGHIACNWELIAPPGYVVVATLQALQIKGPAFIGLYNGDLAESQLIFSWNVSDATNVSVKDFGRYSNKMRALLEFGLYNTTIEVHVRYWAEITSTPASPTIQPTLNPIHSCSSIMPLASNTPGEFHSPNFTGDYTCKWLIKSDNDWIRLEFSSIEFNGLLQVYSGISVDSRNLITNITNIGSNGYVVIAAVSSVTVVLSSNLLADSQGFTARYYALNSTSEMEMIGFSGGAFMSPGYPKLYKPVDELMWLISVSDESRIMLQLRELQMENGDSFIVYNENITSPTGAPTATKKVYHSECHAMAVKFESDGLGSGSAFVATYEEECCASDECYYNPAMKYGIIAGLFCISVGGILILVGLIRCCCFPHHTHRTITNGGYSRFDYGNNPNKISRAGLLVPARHNVPANSSLAISAEKLDKILDPEKLSALK